MSDPPVILKVRLGDLVTLIVTVVGGILSKALNKTLWVVGGELVRFKQEIGEGVARADCRPVAAGESASCPSRPRVVLARWPRVRPKY